MEAAQSALLTASLCKR